MERLAADLPRPVSPTVLVNELQLNRSTCYNILATLQRTGWVTKLEARGGWTLGPGLLSLTGLSEDSAVIMIQEEIDGLARQIDQLVFAVKQDGSGGYTVVAVADPRRGVRVTVGVGDRFPFSAPAIMQAMYAHRPFEEFRTVIRTRIVERFTEHTVTDVDGLAQTFADVRAHGYSTSIRQFDLAQSAAAAPIFDRSGRAHLVLGVLTFSSELDADNIAPVGRLVHATADRLTERTGGTLPVDVDGGVPVADATAT
ncbi:IclR family transcriptional regulator [Pseudonocardia kongjuensis]